MWKQMPQCKRIRFVYLSINLSIPSILFSFFLKKYDLDMFLMYCDIYNIQIQIYARNVSVTFCVMVIVRVNLSYSTHTQHTTVHLHNLTNYQQSCTDPRALRKSDSKMNVSECICVDDKHYLTPESFLVVRFHCCRLKSSASYPQKSTFQISQGTFVQNVPNNGSL